MTASSSSNDNSKSKPSASNRGAALRIGASVLLTLALAIVVEASIGWSRLFSVWAKLSVIEIATAFLAVLASYAMRGARIALWLRFGASQGLIDNKQSATVKNCTVLFLRHNLINVLLPFRTGEIAFPLLLRAQFHVSMGRAVSMLLWLRALDFAALLTLGGCSIIAAHFGFIASTAALACCIVLCMKLPDIVDAIGASGARLALPERLRAPVARSLGALLESPPRRRAWHGVVALSLGNWALKLMSFAFVLSALVQCSLFAALGGAIGGELSSVLPTHGLAGAGSYEAGAVAGLMSAGIAFAPSLAGAVNLHIFMLACALFGGTLAYMARSGPQHPPLSTDE